MTEDTADTLTKETLVTTQNATIQSTLVLRILSGPHAGAEITLQEKPLCLGRDESCDIVLVDDALQSRHMNIFIKEGSVFCVPEQGADVFVDGVRIDKELTLQNFQPIVCGTTLMAVGNENVVWPHIEPPKPREQQDVAEEDPEKTSEITSTPPSKTKKFDLKKVKTFVFVSNHWAHFKHKRSLIVALLSLACIFCYWLFFHSSEKSSSTDPTATFPIVSLKKSIETVLEAENIDPNLTKISLSGQRFILSCYVATNQEKVELEKKLKALPRISFQSIHIYSQEKLIEQAQDLLAGAQTLKIGPGPELDTVVLKGYLYSIETLPSIKNKLLSDVSGLNGIETTLLSPDEIYDLASNLLTENNLMGLLKIQPVKTGLMVMGNIQSSDEPTWKTTQKALKKCFSDICKVLTYVAVVAPQAVKRIFFPSSITTVSIPEKGKPWVDLKNGERYFEGTLLPSSYKIKSITNEGILLQKNEDAVFFSLAEL